MLKQAKNYEAEIRSMIGILQSLIEPSPVEGRGSVIADIRYRHSHSTRPDGYGNSSPGARTAPTEDPSDSRDKLHARSGAPIKSSPGYAGSPTESTLMARQSAPVADPIGEAVTVIFSNLVKARTAIALIDKKRIVVMSAADKRRREDTPDNCIACHRPVEGTPADPIRKGLCDACRKAFGVWRNVEGHRTNDVSTDRRVFALQRRKHEGHLEAACPVCEVERYRVEGPR